MSEVRPTLVVFVDVDETFIRNYGNTRIPIPAVIARVRQLHEQGAALLEFGRGGSCPRKCYGSRN